MHTSGAAYLERTTPATGIEVLRAHTPVEHWGFHDDQLSALQPSWPRTVAVSLVNVAVARSVPVLVHRFPTCVPVFPGPL